MEWREAYPDATAAIHTLIVIIVSQTLKLATSIVNNIILGNTDAPAVVLVYTIITKNQTVPVQAAYYAMAMQPPHRKSY